MTWRIEARSLGMIVLACAVVAFILMVFALGCSAPAAKSAADRQACYARENAATQLEIARRCNTETFAECPEHDAIMADWERRARACQ